ncbi:MULTISPECIES: class I SAM-dependent methyltransferase [Marinobacter]|uniref:Calmodulin-lysine N-methyltransferase n=1 Tax=Marinobacter xiaoshiensis TaxID=3073652 RepID=A0ABU2HGB0_9GAMM|nr:MULTISPECIES: histidine kinase [unclassified Marinobacter]MBK1874436.1 histidine kinase [Marinobacter sp. 1-3A]MDS1310113.1 histidine kinase [Marinobacter sp. F60267]
MKSPLRLRYQTIEFGNVDIHVCTLRDNQQFDDPNDIALKLGISSATWPLFGIIWPSSLVLAHYIVNHPTEGKRILEIGCGMALSSLLLNERNDDITATDYHPEVGVFLERNTQLNHGKAIGYQRVDWADKASDLGLFDIIIGSDVLYEDEHINLLADFIDRHANTACEVILVDPGRGRKNKFSRRMETHGFSFSEEKPECTDYLDKPFKGHVLKFRRGDAPSPPGSDSSSNA